MQILTLLKIPTGFKPAEITEFDCSEAELTLTDVDFTEFPNLRKLSLRNNLIKSLESNFILDQLILFLDSGIDKLTDLVALDLSHNKIKDITQVQTVVNRLKKLEMVFLDENPCWAQEKEYFTL
jgi:Leucine-rich repeat (LRR) protein